MKVNWALGGGVGVKQITAIRTPSDWNNAFS